MVLKKCHFDDLFKEILENIETEFDKDFEQEIFYDLEGETDHSIGLKIATYRRYIVSAMWDIHENESPEFIPEAKTFIKDLIILLLYLYKKLKEEQ